MSIRKNISTLPNTGRSFAPNRSGISNIAGVFVHKEGWTFTDADLDNPNFFFDSFESLDLMPLHYVRDVLNKSEETIYGESAQNFTYEQNPGNYRHVLRFDWGLAYRQIVQEYSGTNVYVVYYDSNRNILATEESPGVYRGFTTNRLVLEKMPAFGNGSEPVWSDLDIELYDSDELNESNGYNRCVDWMPRLIDKLFISINIGAAGSNFLNFTAKYNSKDVLTIKQTDITLSDENNGNLSFSVFNLDGGVYKISGVTPDLTTGCLIVNSATYLGQTRYIATSIVEVINNYLFEDGENFIFEDGENFIYNN